MYTYGVSARLGGVNGIAYSRLANSELIENITRPNGVNTTWGFEQYRNLATQVAHGTAGTYGYTNDALGRRNTMTRNAELLTYAYNDRSEVIGATSDTNPAYNYSYSYDPIGNRQNANLAGTSFSYTTNNLNQYTEVNAAALSYDQDGNMLTRDGWTQEWNGENRLIRMTKGMVKLEFEYDYMGRRIFKKVYENENLTKYLKFVYDEYKLAEELDGLNEDTVLRRYVWQPEELGQDIPLTETEGSAVYYYHADANKNITELTDADGTVVAHYEYSPFGVQTIATGAYAAGNPFRFSSEYFDEETQLVYYNYRYYAPHLGRWLSRDPIGEDGGLNLYGMVDNNPLAFWDALGLEGGLPSTGTLFKRMLSSMFRGDNLLRAADNIAETFRPCDVAVRIAVEPYDWTRTLFDAYMGTATPLDFAGFLPFVPGGLGKGAKMAQGLGRPPNLSPVGAGRNGAFRQAKRDAGVPVTQQPSKVTGSVDRSGKPMAGLTYEFPNPQNPAEPIKIMEHRGGHNFGPNNPQNRGPHFNTPNGGHYDY